MLPETIRTEEELLDVMTRPKPVLVEFMQTLSSPLVILGAGGKMGPSLAVLARRAADAADLNLEIIAVSRFSDGRARDYLEARGVRTINADLMDRHAFKSLPDTDNLLYMVGLKFGTSSNPVRTWATNTLVPAFTAERYSQSRIVALSTGNVYPLVSVEGSGSQETDPLTPMGEYSNTCVARERLFEYYSELNSTPMVLLRLSFALDLRYGVLVDIAQKVYQGEPVNVSMSHINCIWQGDANEMIIRSLALAAVPPVPLNLVGGDHYSIRQTALHFGELLGKEVLFTGTEARTAFLSDNSRLRSTLGEPSTPIETVMRWTAAWVRSEGRLLNKPTHFEVRDGGY
jgi:nucleoside-diphosphate-sugar epimerase